MAVRITITSAGANISSTLDIYTGATPSTLVLFESGVALLSLQAGYTFTPAANAYYYEVRDTGSCGSVLSLSCSPPATTIAPTTTTMAPTTMAPTTMAPTTMAPTTMAPTTMAPTTMAPSQTTTTTTKAETTTTTTKADTTSTTSTTSTTTQALAELVIENESSVIGIGDSPGIYVGGVAIELIDDTWPLGMGIFHGTTPNLGLQTVEVRCYGDESDYGIQVGSSPCQLYIGTGTYTFNNVNVADVLNISLKYNLCAADTTSTTTSTTTIMTLYPVTGYTSEFSEEICDGSAGTISDVYSLVQNDTLRDHVVYYYNNGDPYVGSNYYANSRGPLTEFGRFAGVSAGEFIFESACTTTSTSTSTTSTTSTTTSAPGSIQVFRFNDNSDPISMCGLLPYEFSGFTQATLYRSGGFTPHETISPPLYTNIGLTDVFVPGNNYYWGVMFNSNPIDHTVYITSEGEMNTWTNCPEATTTTTTIALATLAIQQHTNITNTSVDVQSIISDEGGASVTERGVCWNQTGTPITSDDKMINGSGGLGEFWSYITGLTEGTTYYVRAYAINSVGTAYSNQISFATTIPVDTAIIYRYTNDDDPIVMCGLLPYQFPNPGTFTSITIYKAGSFEIGTTINITVPGGVYTDIGLTQPLTSHVNWAVNKTWGYADNSTTVDHTIYISSTDIGTWIDCSNVTTTTTTAAPPTTTTTQELVYYKIQLCPLTGEYREVGPVVAGTYSSGQRVEGATSTYYLVETFQSSSYGYPNISVTNTGQMGCPS